LITDPTPGNPLPTISRRLNGGSTRSGGFDDIPVALRTRPPKSKRRFVRPLLLGSGGVIFIGAVFVFAFPQPLRQWLTPAPVAGLAEKPGRDGRLLGHFPYSEASEAELVEVGAGHRLQADAAREWLAMQEAARWDGIDLQLLSAYRSVAEQTTIFFDVKSERNQTARDRARVSAPPGYSEHSTGYALDLGDANEPGTHLSNSFEQTAAFAWLKANAQRYHFVLSFPTGNRQGVSYEPWHWRFEGTAAALKVFEPAGRLAVR
jgi:D-alanyl-D-alanine carboxypeptidase